MKDYADSEILLYDLSNRPASFDFVTCLATAPALGCKHVRFVHGKWKPKNYTERQAEERWHSIVEPASALYGLTYTIGERRGLEVNHLLRAAVQTYKETPGHAGRDPEREREIAERLAARTPDLDERTWEPVVTALVETGLDVAERRATHADRRTT